jgi:ATP-dependent Clp protease protease subunit
MPKLTRDDISNFFNFNISIPGKVLYIGEPDGTEHTMAESVLKGLTILDSINQCKKLTIYMNNPGGDEYHGLAIYDAIASCRSKTVVRVFGHAMSMGAWILQAADVRLMSHNSTLMLHYGSASFDGHNKNLDRAAKESERLNTLMEDHLLERIKEKHPRYTREALQELIKYDRYLSASEAVELGLADKVV